MTSKADAASRERAMLQGVIFDLDGTLADTLDVCIEAFQYAIAEHTGRRLSPAEVVTLWGPTEEGVLREAVGPEWEHSVETFLAEYERLHVAVPEPFPGIRDLLAHLVAAGIPTGVVTGKGARSAQISLEVLGIDGYFDVVEAGSIDGPVKKEKIAHIVERWGVPAGTVVYVGDHPHDAIHAHAAGTLAVGAAWSHHTDIDALRRSAPDEFFDSSTDFAAWLMGRTAKGPAAMPDGLHEGDDDG
jgi:phosphoglycolate phosphatase-like HAD superfamily hydrolase